VHNVLLAIPNISEGSDQRIIGAVRDAYVNAGATVLDQTSDADHGRSVHTLAGSQQELASAIAAGWKVAVEMINLTSTTGVHPHVGALDVAPFVFLDEAQRGAACAAALTTAGQLGRSGASVLLYGLLAGGRTRAELRAGGVAGLQGRIESGVQIVDFGPAQLAMRSGAVLVSARPPLIAFNLRLSAEASLADARDTAALLREGGADGLAGLRVLAFELRDQGFLQLSFNLEDPDRTGLGQLVAAVRDRHEVESGELIGLAPRRYIDEIPDDLPMPNFDPDRKSVEGSLRFHGISS
jgi:glutamate formiminotransferase